MSNGPLRIGIGGPVGTGKTTLTEKLCKAMRDDFSLAVVTNDIYTREDAMMLARLQALPEERIMGVETGGCPHTAIREDASINLAAIAELNAKFPDLDIVFIESGGDNLSRHLLARPRRPHPLRHLGVPGRRHPAQGRAGHHPLRLSRHQQGRSGAPCERRSRGYAARCPRRARAQNPSASPTCRAEAGVDEIVAFIVDNGGLAAPAVRASA